MGDTPATPRVSETWVTGLDPLSRQPPLPLPSGQSRENILRVLTSFQIDGGSMGELEGYARQDCDRFLYTLAQLPPGRAKVLEVGSNPYFTTALIRKFRPDLEVTSLNYFGGPIEWRKQTVEHAVYEGSGQESFTVDYLNINIETDALPFEDDAFDIVLYCEVVEHMTNDPVVSLAHLKAVLRPGGLMIVTTPNVARLENVARLISGANIYDPYSGYGPYGRHNREYNRHELHKLLNYCGFSVDVSFTADVHPNHSAHYVDLDRLSDLIGFRADDLGQYLFIRCTNDGEAPTQLPGWLYRSYPDGVIDHASTL